MNKDVKRSNDWTKCPDGALDAMVGRIRSKRRANVARSIGGSLVVLVLLGGAVGYLVQQQQVSPSNGNYGNLTCVEVKSLLPQQRAGQLDTAMTERLATHLRECPRCAYLRGSMAPDGIQVSQTHGPPAPPEFEVVGTVGTWP